MRFRYEDISPYAVSTPARMALMPIDVSGQERTVLHPTRKTILDLAQLEEDWDGAGSAAPNRTAILRADGVAESLYRQVTVHKGGEIGAGLLANNPWGNPHVSASEDGEVVFEWWKDERKLTLYIGSENDSFVTVWGPRVDTDMSVGAFSASTTQFASLWKWLNS
ncbi:MAG: hypothetical protein JO142_11910 [Burkholderiales bacterium]|nr:hypothetical protein [Burkholderiales bacterium]